MQSLAYPLVNGCRHSFSSVELNLAGLIFVGFTAINYTRTRSRTMVYGPHPDPIGKTRGKNEYKADCELYFAEFNLFKSTLGPGYGDIPFSVQVTYTENGFDTIIDTILGCTLDSTEASNAEGTDPTKRKFEMNPIKILFNNEDDLTTPLVGVQT